MNSLSFLSIPVKISYGNESVTLVEVTWNILISNDEMKSGEVGRNEVNECKGIFSPHQRLDTCCKYCTSSFEANSL